MKKRFSFTLVELLGAMALIVILAGIAFSGYSYAMNKAKESATTSTIKQIETALEAAKIKAGYFPANKVNEYTPIAFYTKNGILLEIRIGKLKDIEGELSNHVQKVKNSDIDKVAILNESQNKQLFAEVKKILDLEAIFSNSEIIFDKTEEEDGKEVQHIVYILEDAFGGKIYYRFPGKINKTGFDLVSAGADGVFAKDDDGKPDNGSARSDYYDGSERIVDDISNF